MNCRTFERLLEPFADGSLGAGERAAVERHLLECERCRDLVALARIAIEPDDPRAAAPPPELVAEVLRRTAGPACRAAERVLCDHVEGRLPADGSELLAAHLGGCADCRALAGALAALASDLPTLAEIRPDARFVDAVLAATLPWHVRLVRWWRRGWPRWVARPRFAAETAYVATLVLVLVFSTPGSPLEAMPRRAAELARRAVPARAVGAPWARLEATVAPRLEAVKSSEPARAVAGGWQATADFAARTFDRALALGGEARDWGGERLRTFRQWLASMLERADETPSTTDHDSDEEQE